MVQITEKGKKALASHLQLKDIEGSAGFMNFYAEEKTKGLRFINKYKALPRRT
jgi:hypothetical protein